MNIVIEKPTDQEIGALISEFGFIPEFELADPMGFMLEREYHSDGSVIGEVVLVIEHDLSRIVLVTHPNSFNDWVFLMGRMIAGETIEMAVKREAKEETGFDVVLMEVLAIYRILFTFKNCKLVRWHFLVSAKAIGGELNPLDTSEINGVKRVPLYRLSLEGKSCWSKFWHHSLLSIYHSRLENAMGLLAENGHLIRYGVSLTDLSYYFSDEAPSGDITTLHDVFRNQWLLCHEIVEIDELKGLELAISATLLNSHHEEVMRAHVKASEVELMLARRFGDKR